MVVAMEPNLNFRLFYTSVSYSEAKNVTVV